MRVGIGFNTDLPVSQIVHYIQLAEELRFDSFWLHEHSFSRDALSFVTSASESTKRIGLGVGCVSAYTRHPIVLAMSFLTLNESSQGRAMMGIGTGFPMRLDLMGVKHDKPIGAVKETIEICRSIWNGELVNYQGQTYSIKNVKALTGKTASKIPIYIAGWKKMMLAITGKYADGYIAKGGESPQSLKRLVSGIRSSAEKNHRRIEEIDISAYLLTFVGETQSEALARAKKDPFVNYMLSVQDDYLYEETGIDPTLKKPIAENYFKGNVAEASSHVTDEMIEAFTLVGTAEQVTERVREYQRSGLNLAILQPISLKTEEIQSVLKAGSILKEENRSDLMPPLER